MIIERKRPPAQIMCLIPSSMLNLWHMKRNWSQDPPHCFSFPLPLIIPIILHFHLSIPVVCVLVLASQPETLYSLDICVTWSYEV